MDNVLPLKCASLRRDDRATSGQIDARCDNHYNCPPRFAGASQSPKSRAGLSRATSHDTMTNVFTALHLFALANILFCLSYLVRDILWLRILAIFAASCAIPYFLLQTPPLYWPVFWQSAFILINVVHAVILIRERMPVDISDEERRLHTLAFRPLSSRELLRVSAAAEWRDAAPGEVLLRQGEVSERILLVFHGVLQVRQSGQVRAHLRDGQFAGEMSLIRRKPHTADVIAAEPTRYLVWNRQALDRLWRRHAKIKAVFESLIGMDMAEKLVGERDTDPETLGGEARQSPSGG